jgi:hypothetical protein
MISCERSGLAAFADSTWIMTLVSMNARSFALMGFQPVEAEALGQLAAQPSQASQAKSSRGAGFFSTSSDRVPTTWMSSWSCASKTPTGSSRAKGSP